MENNNNRKLTKKKTKYHIQNNHNMKINRKKKRKKSLFFVFPLLFILRAKIVSFIIQLILFSLCYYMCIYAYAVMLLHIRRPEYNILNPALARRE